MLNKKELHKYLSLLAKKIEFRGKGTYNLVVCGGASMIYTGFSAATTKDVDIIGIIDKRLTGNNSIKECTELPFVLKQMVFEIATD
ncbi:MAG: DUF6036 family nucleotidyltransferase [Elusimicrobia bacterium]|jgi:hypothetical protein|nr:DUF6036 family nucleotidyltransferase [Elusimicrobiota bacterium]